MQPSLLMDDGKVGRVQVGRVHERDYERAGAVSSVVHVCEDGEL